MKDSLPNWGDRYPIANETLHPVPISEPVIENNMDVNGNSGNHTLIFTFSKGNKQRRVVRPQFFMR